MRIALLNSGLGLLAAAAQLHQLRPDADLVLSMDPDGMPWGGRTPADIAERSLSCARAAAAYRPDVLVFACNTGSVHALGALREEFEPGIPVVGTVPAIKPAAATSDAVAIWATAATTGSAYQRELISEFAASAQVAEVACPGLADAIHAGDASAARAAILDAAARTPADCGAIVLGCTEYELAADLIGDALPGAVLFGSAAAVAAQALRRADTAGDGSGQAPGTGPASAAAPEGGIAPGRAVSIGCGARTAPDPGTVPGPGTAPGPGSAGNLGTASNSSIAQNPATIRNTTNDLATSGNSSSADDFAAARNAGITRGVATSGNASITRAASTGTLQVLLSGRSSGLPPAALRYPEGRLLAALPPAPPPSAQPVTGNPAAGSSLPIRT